MKYRALTPFPRTLRLGLKMRTVLPSCLHERRGEKFHATKINAQDEQGMILLITLIFLFAMTVLALTTIGLNTSLTRIGTNHANTEINFQTTEGTSNQVLQNILKGQYNSSSFISNNNGLYLLNTNNTPLWSSISWQGGAVQSGFQGSSSSPASFFIEQLPSVIKPGQNINRTIKIYRITARTSNGASNTAAIMQTTVQVPQ